MWNLIFGLSLRFCVLLWWPLSFFYSLFTMAAAPTTRTCLVPDIYLEDTKLEILLPCLFDQISHFDYVSFCLSYQNRLKGIGKKIFEVSSIPCTCGTYVPDNYVKVRFQLYCFLVDWLMGVKHWNASPLPQ